MLKQTDFARAFGAHLARLGVTQDKTVRLELARFAIDAGIQGARDTDRFIQDGVSAWDAQRGEGTTKQQGPVVATRAESG